MKLKQWYYLWIKKEKLLTQKEQKFIVNSNYTVLDNQKKKTNWFGYRKKKTKKNGKRKNSRLNSKWREQQNYAFSGCDPYHRLSFLTKKRNKNYFGHLKFLNNIYSLSTCCVAFCYPRLI